MRSFACRGADQLARCAATIAKLSPDKVWTIEVGERKSKRSTDQNARYFAILRAIGDETGNDIDDLHEVFKRLFLGTKSITVNGGSFEVSEKSSRSDTADFSAYMEKVEAYAAREWGIAL